MIINLAINLVRFFYFKKKVKINLQITKIILIFTVSNINVMKNILLTFASLLLISLGYGETKISLLPNCKLPIVTLSVNGKLGNFLVDSGASNSIISNYASPDYSLKFTLSESDDGLSGLSGTQSKTYNVRNLVLSVENIELKNGTVKGADIHNIINSVYKLCDVEIIGLVGMSFLKENNIFLDLKSNELIINNLTENSPTIKMANKKMPIVELTINGQKGKFLLDTGASISLLDIDVNKKYGITFVDTNTSVMGVGGISNSINTSPTQINSLEGLKLSDMSFKVQNIKNIINVIGNNDNVLIMGVLGMDFIRNNSLSVDFGNKHILASN